MSSVRDPACLHDACYFGFSMEAAMDEHEDFRIFHRYDDPITFKLIGTVSKVLGTFIRGDKVIFDDD